MRNEEVFFYKLMLLCGYPEEVNQAISTALDHQNPIEPDILDLSACGNDAKKQLSVLNAILARAGEELLDHQAVFELVRQFLHQQYTGGMDIPALVKLMYRIAIETGWWDEDPWNTLYLMEDYYDDACAGIKGLNHFLHGIEHFLSDGRIENATVHCASMSDILEIRENRIVYRNKQGTVAFVDLIRCAENYRRIHPGSKSGLCCVGERLFSRNAYYEFCDSEPVRFTLCVETSQFKQVISRLFGWNFHTNKYKVFHGLQQRLNEMGYTTLDLS